MAESVRQALRDLLDAIPDATAEADPPLSAWMDAAEAALREATPETPQRERLADCPHMSPPEWTDHWREWHQGHGCKLDPDTLPEAQREAKTPTHLLHTLTNKQVAARLADRGLRICDEAARRLLATPEPPEDAPPARVLPPNVGVLYTVPSELTTMTAAHWADAERQIRRAPKDAARCIENLMGEIYALSQRLESYAPPAPPLTDSMIMQMLGEARLAEQRAGEDALALDCTPQQVYDIEIAARCETIRSYLCQAGILADAPPASEPTRGKWSLADVGITPHVKPEPHVAHWSVAVDYNGENIVTLESNCLSGKPDLSKRDEDVIQLAARCLISFAGAPERDRQ